MSSTICSCKLMLKSFHNIIKYRMSPSSGLTLLLHILDIPGSDLSMETGYSECVFLDPPGEFQNSAFQIRP